MEEHTPADTLSLSAAGLEYPVEFELRVIHVLAEGDSLAEQLKRILEERQVSLEKPRSLPASNAKYGKLACRVRFEDKDSLYAAYTAIGALPGVKVVL
ncbi:MAG: hypothetical protein A2Y38_26265 [Spirochaetes bacterium GWB1_59_5]|nr:MAG: hypothetical protein A2Y38_26265 [Spirochaetes bacterium GWB1_59_5]